MHSRTGDTVLAPRASLLAHTENRFSNLKVEGRVALSWNLHFSDIFRCESTSRYRSRRREREGRGEERREEEEERKIVIADPSIGKHPYVANEEVYASCLDA